MFFAFMRNDSFSKQKCTKYVYPNVIKKLNDECSYLSISLNHDLLSTWFFFSSIFHKKSCVKTIILTMSQFAATTQVHQHFYHNINQ